jgi:phenylacetate-CoA ligase
MPLQPFLFDIAKGTKVNAYFKKFKGFNQLSRNEIKIIQLEKLKNQIAHFYGCNKFFRNRMDSVGMLPGDIASLEDLKRIPILERQDLQTNYNLLLTPSDSKVFYGSSSGTTGTPVRYAKDVNGISAGQAAGYNLWALAGWSFKMRKAHVWGNPTSITKWNKPSSKAKAWVYNQLNIPSVLANTYDGAVEVLNTIKAFKPTCIEGYASSIFDLARIAKERCLSFPWVKCVITTGEALLPQQNELITEVFAPVSDMYGCGEINGVAIKTPNSNKYYIADYHVVVEANYNALSDQYEVLLTDLDNRAFPFIRYRVGDIIDGVFEPEHNEPFPFTYFTSLGGRTVDTVYLPNGKCIQPINLLGGTLFRQIGGVKQHKVIWQNNRLKFLFAIDSTYNNDVAKTRIGKYLKEYEVLFEIEIVDSIASGPSGKYKFFERID